MKILYFNVVLALANSWDEKIYTKYPWLWRVMGFLEQNLKVENLNKLTWVLGNSKCSITTGWISSPVNWTWSCYRLGDDIVHCISYLLLHYKLPQDRQSLLLHSFWALLVVLTQAALSRGWNQDVAWVPSHQVGWGICR